MDIQLADKSRVPAIIAALLVAASLVLGGGGSSAPFSELLLQLVAAFAAIAWLVLHGRTDSGHGPLDGRLVVLTILVLALPILQLIPLPPAVWQALPGREVEKSALDLIGESAAWMPWSMAPARTLASLLSLLPPLLAMVMVSRLDREDRDLVLAGVVLVTIASLLLGALQLSSGNNGAWRIYDDNLGFLNGFQANRNAESDVLLIGLVAGAAICRSWDEKLDAGLNRWVLCALAALPLLGCILTGSRTGMVLIPFAIAAVAIIWVPVRFGWRQVLVAIGGMVALVGTGFFVLRDNARIAYSLDRFSNGRDFRFELWTDTQYAIGQYWPFGSGLGSFKSTFAAAERLEVVDPTWPVRAHNDFLELALEGGIFGLALLAAAAAVLGSMIVRAWPSRNSAVWPQFVFALLVFVVVTMHSVVDYPMRSMSLACLVGVAAGFLVPIRHGRH